MRIGAALFLIAVGAILRFAVTAKVSGVDVPTVGVILMVVGLAGLLFELFMMANRRRTTVITTQRHLVAPAPVVTQTPVVTQSPTVAYVDPADPRAY